MNSKPHKFEPESLKNLEKQGFGPLTLDAFLGGQVRLIQLEKGYRAGMDAVLLAATINAKPGDKALDLGAGTGGVAICLARRCQGVLIDGLEIQTDLATLARHNAALNGFSERIRVIEGSILGDVPDLPQNHYDHVFANPPYLETKSAIHSPSETKDLAHTGKGGAALEDWVKFAVSRARQKGTVTFIFRADRLDELLSALHKRAGEAVIFPLWPHEGEPARRVIVQARRGLHGGATLAPGLVLHGETERYTRAAEDVLRHGKAIDLACYHRAKGP